MLISRFGTVRVFSKGIENTPHAGILLSAIADRVIYSSQRPARGERPDAVAGWGYRPSADKARVAAASWGVPYIALEDGFFRSVGLGTTGQPALSFVADDVGIYYDEQRRSRLHEAIAAGLDEKIRARAQSLIALIRDKRLSKYNTGHDELPADIRFLRGKSVLLVDQTRGDASLGRDSVAAFSVMISQARRDHPDAEILIKTHPDVLTGKKEGCFSPQDMAAPGVRVIAEDINPHALFDIVDNVYVSSSGLGFEALIAGKTVHCLGRPWYAGYGLTRDAAGFEQGQPSTLEDLFAASCLSYSLYIDPYERKACTPEQAFDTLAFLKEKADRFRGRTVVFGVSRRRRELFEPYLLGSALPILHAERAQDAASLAAQNGARLVAWGSKITPALEQDCADRGVTMVRAEDGFLRSIGLGTGMIPAASLVFDGTGIYYDSRRESRIEKILNAGISDPVILERARALRQEVLKRGLTKYNTGSRSCPSIPPGRDGILVAGQVQDDASIRYGTRDVATNLDLLRAVRATRPDGFIIYKPHPDVMAGYRLGHIDPAEAARYADIVCGDVSADALLPLVKEVHVMSSLIGFEALLRGCAVFTYGMPFYAGWGLTTDHLGCERRTRKASLDELTAATLILYPDYVDLEAKLPCSPEIVLEKLAHGPVYRANKVLRLYRRMTKGIMGRRAERKA